MSEHMVLEIPNDPNKLIFLVAELLALLVKAADASDHINHMCNPDTAAATASLGGRMAAGIRASIAGLLETVGTPANQNDPAVQQHWLRQKPAAR